MIDHRHAAAKDGVLQPVPGLRVEHLAGADHALQRRVIDVGERLLAVAHQHADGGRRREDPGGAVPSDHRAASAPAGVGWSSAPSKTTVVQPASSGAYTM